jgi:hypothetical protein
LIRRNLAALRWPNSTKPVTRTDDQILG